jgi:hypothetical protein
MRAWVELSSYNNINAGNDPNNTSYDCRSQDGYHLDAVLGFDEILEMISKKEELPPMKAGNIFHVWPVYILMGCIQDVECVLGWLLAYHIPLKDFFYKV